MKFYDNPFTLIRLVSISFPGITGGSLSIPRVVLSTMRATWVQRDFDSEIGKLTGGSLSIPRVVLSTMRATWVQRDFDSEIGRLTGGSLSIPRVVL